jgi:hypothetical protein
MTDHADKAAALAGKITAKAEDTLRNLEWEMTKWPAEYRAIMWGAVADIAFKRKVEAETSAPTGKQAP